MTNKITPEIIADLNNKSVDCKRKTLTELHKKGVYIKPYLEEMLGHIGEIHFDSENHGFKPLIYGREDLVIYTLEDDKTSFIYKKLSNGKYKPWL